MSKIDWNKPETWVLHDDKDKPHESRYKYIGEGLSGNRVVQVGMDFQLFDNEGRCKTSGRWRVVPRNYHKLPTPKGREVEFRNTASQQAGVWFRVGEYYGGITVEGSVSLSYSFAEAWHNKYKKPNEYKIPNLPAGLAKIDELVDAEEGKAANKITITSPTQEIENAANGLKKFQDELGEHVKKRPAIDPHKPHPRVTLWDHYDMSKSPSFVKQVRIDGCIVGSIQSDGTYRAGSVNMFCPTPNAAISEQVAAFDWSKLVAEYDAKHKPQAVAWSCQFVTPPIGFSGTPCGIGGAK